MPPVAAVLRYGCGLRVRVTSSTLASKTVTSRIEDAEALSETTEASRFLFETVFVASSDGVDIPLSIVRPRGAKAGPVVLYGYGSYGELVFTTGHHVTASTEHFEQFCLLANITQRRIRLNQGQPFCKP